MQKKKQKAKKKPTGVTFGMFKGDRVTNPEDFQIAEWHGDSADTVRVVRERLASIAKGERGIPLKEFDAAMRKKYGIRLDPRSAKL